MKITKDQFKNLCEKLYEQNDELAIRAVDHYLYAIAPVGAIPNDGVKPVDLVSMPTTEAQAEKALDHHKSFGVQYREFAQKPGLMSQVERLRALRAMRCAHDNTTKKESNEEPIDAWDDDDPELQKLKLEWETLDIDQKDLGRIYTIDIKNTFSLHRIAAYFRLLSQFAYELPGYDQEDFQNRLNKYTKIVEYSNDLNDKYNQMLAYWAATTSIDIEAPLKNFHLLRTRKSTESKRINRKIKEGYVYDAFLKLIQNKKNEERKTIAALSEQRMAGLIKDEIEDDLKKKKINGISGKTIIDILRKRDKGKFPFYPWEDRSTSKM